MKPKLFLQFVGIVQWRLLNINELRLYKYVRYTPQTMLFWMFWYINTTQTISVQIPSQSPLFLIGTVLNTPYSHPWKNTTQKTCSNRHTLLKGSTQTTPQGL